jgi:hypothetical protein
MGSAPTTEPPQPSDGEVDHKLPGAFFSGE